MTEPGEPCKVAVTHARRQLDQLIEDITADNSYIVITRRGKPAAALITMERYVLPADEHIRK